MRLSRKALGWSSKWLDLDTVNGKSLGPQWLRKKVNSAEDYVTSGYMARGPSDASLRWSGLRDTFLAFSPKRKPEKLSTAQWSTWHVHPPQEVTSKPCATGEMNINQWGESKKHPQVTLLVWIPKNALMTDLGVPRLEETSKEVCVSMVTVAAYDWEPQVPPREDHQWGNPIEEWQHLERKLEKREKLSYL